MKIEECEEWELIQTIPIVIPTWALFTNNENEIYRPIHIWGLYEPSSLDIKNKVMGLCISRKGMVCAESLLTFTNYVEELPEELPEELSEIELD